MQSPPYFPPGFVLGCATSSYQIEGATEVDGRGESIWDRFARKPGSIDDGSSGAQACDHYHRYADDVALMADLGVHSYRFSIAWPRILPNGSGQVNQAGLDFYKRLVDALLAAGIRPFATLYHWDLPQALEDRGGWPVRDTAQAFARYAEVVAVALGDRVQDWITHNEPWCASILGYEEGRHAPGRKSTPDALAAAHHMLLSHGLAVPAIRAHSPGARVGITLNLCPAEPASASAADAKACRIFDGWFNRWYLDPLFGKGYPQDIVEHHRQRGHLPAGPLPFEEAGDLDTIAVETDFFGINYYNRAIVRDETVPEKERAPATVERAPTSEDTDMGWEVYPEGLYNTLVRVHQDYAPTQIYVTECGAAYDTPPDEDGSVPDSRRVRFLHNHFLQTRRAIDAGVPVSGFFVWSLFDNFEWSFGYQMRFGIVWVDYATQQRTLKASARWLQQAIEAHDRQTTMPTQSASPHEADERPTTQGSV